MSLMERNNYSVCMAVCDLGTAGPTKLYRIFFARSPWLRVALQLVVSRPRAIGKVSGFKG